MNYYWSVSEIIMLQDCNNLGNEIASLHVDEITDNMQSDFLSLEAALLILNKYVIGYIDGSPNGVYRFNEALRLESFYLHKDNVFIFLPIAKEVTINIV